MSKVGEKNKIRRNLILRALLDNGQLSLTEISSFTGISTPVVSTIVASLKESKLVIEVEEKIVNQAGRPPLFIKINGSAGYVLGIDIGRTKTTFVVLDLEQNIVFDVIKNSIDITNNLTVIDLLYKEIKEVVKQANLKWEQIIGIGISIPGIVQGPKGVSKTYMNFGDENLRDLLEKKFEKTVNIEHDVKAMTLGEFWFGAAKNRKNVLCVNVGWGIALGMIINGKLYYGSNSYAGEFGHVQIIPNGALCYCGKRGCLETVASGKAMAEIAQTRITAGAVSKLNMMINNNVASIDAKMIIDAAKEGDQFSIELIEEAGRYIGYGIAQLINIFDPELIILGGRISSSEDFLVNAISSTAIKHSLTHVSKNIEFVISKLGSKAGAMGVARVAGSELFEVDHLNPSAYV